MQINLQWSRVFYPNKLREFIFKFYNNLLGLNTRVSHFNREIARACTFCTAMNKNPVPDETFEHLFFSCSVTENIRNLLIRDFLHDLNANTINEQKKLFFLGVNPIDDSNKNSFLFCVIMHFMHFIWQCKLQKKLPTMQNLLNDIFYNVETIRKNCGEIRDNMANNLTICRIWNDEAGRRR
jgi:hypothetical protein